MPRTCATCASPDVVAVDAGLVAGQPAQALARRYRLDYSTVLRHRRNGHVAAIPSPASLRPGHRRAAGSGSDAQSARAMIVALIADLEGRDTLNETGESTLGTTAWTALQKEKRLAYEALARLDGPPTAPSFDPRSSAEWAELHDAILGALVPYPEARAAFESAVVRVLGPT